MSVEPLRELVSSDGTALPRPRSLWTPGEARPAGRRSSSWLPGYVLSVKVGDLLVIVLSTAGAFLVRFDGIWEVTPELGSWVLLFVLPPLWLGFLVAFRSYEPRFLGVGTEEHTRVLRAAAFALAFVATVSWAFDLDVARGFVVVALPGATLLTLAWRSLARRRLHASRETGRNMQSIILAGHESDVLSMLRHMARSRHHGLEVAGVCLPPARGGRRTQGRTTSTDLGAMGIPVLGHLDDIAHVAHREDVDAVAVLPSPELDGRALRQLGWDLERSRADLLLAPLVSEIVGPRLAIRPVCGLPLLHLNRPEHTGVRRIAKALVDRSVALVMIVALSPALLVLAAAVRVDSRGSALYRQERVGKHGRPFTMWKFRSMATDAEERLIDLRDHSEGGQVLFKMRSDPRVTRVGKWLRAYSLDELPQLFNVLSGRMSLVGPRPPLPSEVARYGDDVHRRLLVKPGMTGLWQINGRSDLSWEESVRLDLRYVENWSFAFDFAILWKTFRAVVRRSGAY